MVRQGIYQTSEYRSIFILNMVVMVPSKIKYHQNISSCFVLNWELFLTGDDDVLSGKFYSSGRPHCWYSPTVIYIQIFQSILITLSINKVGLSVEEQSLPVKTSELGCVDPLISHADRDIICGRYLCITPTTPGLLRLADHDHLINIYIYITSLSSNLESSSTFLIILTFT